MYILIQHLIAFKYACKINHWSTDSYSEHLLYDRLTEDLDTFADNIAESHFMALNKKDVFKPDLLNSKIINKDLVKMCNTIIEYLEKFAGHIGYSARPTERRKGYAKKMLKLAKTLKIDY